MITINGHDLDDISIDGVAVKRIQDAVTLEIMWEKQLPMDDYLYIYNEYPGSATITVYSHKNDEPLNLHATSVEYSFDKNNWTTLTLCTTDYEYVTHTITVPSHGTIYFRNDSGNFNYVDPLYGSGGCYTHIFSDKPFSVGGNINSLVDYRDMWNIQPNYGCFGYLFTTYGVDMDDYYQSPIVYSNDLRIPSSSLPSYCCIRMFDNCNYLQSAPSLPATSVGVMCYRDMFAGCNSLVNSPLLPATSIQRGSYYGMFQGCSSLTTAPALPATTLAGSCYRDMFMGCTGLSSTPELPATTLEQSCYAYMFNYCSSLSSVIISANDISASGCLTNWLQGVSSSGTFHKLGSASFPTNSSSGIPSGWTVVNS